MKTDTPMQRPCKGRTKVKTGCRTCKIRKVKCDEGWPACKRCISTGRECDGYGIWGGGGNRYGERQGAAPGQRKSEIIRTPQDSLTLLLSSPADRAYYEWFTSHTSKKLPGTFFSEFWETLLVQASVDEPAVRHGILCLSSINKKPFVSLDWEYHEYKALDDNDQFSLQQYGKSINSLLPHLSKKDKASYRVTLISCIIFVCVDLLRGHFQTARLHLRQGLTTLKEMQIIDPESDVMCSTRNRGLVEDWIMVPFSRLTFQMELFDHLFQLPRLCLMMPDRPLASMKSVGDAWQHLDHMFYRISHLTHKARVHKSNRLELLEEQQDIRHNLESWKAVFSSGCGRPMAAHQSIHTDVINRLLRIYHTMAVTMMKTAFGAEDELVYDSVTGQFHQLITQLATMWGARAGSYGKKKIPKHLVDMSHSTVDMGWMPPLYYVAVKCRVHRLRLHAIKLMECSIHREGIWDARTVASVARKVMKLEEGDFYRDVALTDDFPLFIPSEVEDFNIPTLPASRRLHDLEVVLSGSPMDKVLLYSKKPELEVKCRVLLSEYNVHTRRWTDSW